MRRHFRTACLVFAVTLLPGPARADAPPAAAAPTDQEWEAMWSDLTRSDDEGTKRAFQVVCRWIQTPVRSVPFLKAHLQPVPAADNQKIAAWIADLNSDHFGVREKATVELEKLGALAAPALKATLTGQAPSLEVRRRLERLVEKVNTNTLSGDELRGLRAVEILEAIGSPEARELIAGLAKGAAGARLTEDAKQAQARLARAATSR